MTTADPFADQAGGVLAGRYALLGEIASGGMATVHYGRLVGPAGFSRAVAIKRLHPQYAKNPEFRVMLLDEARLASHIRHPNVVPILEVVAEAGELYLVMEYVEGESLSRLIPAPAPVPVPIAVAIAVGALEGLHAAHEARGEDKERLHIVHRDVSPQNLLVGVDGVARLIDFGIAKAAGNARITREGEIKGKIAYMAPEQIRGETVDRRTDVYATAVVLWEVLTGRRMLEGGGDALLVHAALSRSFDPPSAHRPDLPAGLDRLVMRGLARDAAERFGTAREMAQALEAVAAPAPAREVGRWVEALAGQALRNRAERVRTMETMSAVPRDGSSAPAAGTSPRPVDPSPGRSPADVSAISVREGTPRLTKRRTFNRSVAAAAILVAAGVGFSVARLIPTRSPDSTASPDAPNAPVVVAGQPASGTASASVTEPMPSAAESTAAVPTEAPSRPRSLVPTPKARTRADCSPPYEITPDGVRKYKQHCLR